ncbi:MAG TPA: phospholipase D-like domain-containing protein [Polyangiaceae bacterium]|nr:phospholipase D-like domain-containing protein [Polyangiaceae bacterium]
MYESHWLLTHEAVSIATSVLALMLAISLLRQRRPAGNLIAWLLAIVLIPYLGIPLYLVFGGRKLRRRSDRMSVPERGSTHAGRESGQTSLQTVRWLDDGVLAYDGFLAEIRGARRSIRIVTFVLANDEVGRPLVEALIERARQGLEVRLLLDDLLRFHAPRRLLRELVSAGARVERFMPLLHVPFRGRSNLRNHRKIAVFDGERAIVGGMNLGREYLGPTPDEARWRDLSLLVAGAAVAELDAVFRADWEFACGERLSAALRQAEGPIALRVVPSGPDSENDAIYDADLSAIFRAETRIWIATPYFVPDEVLMRALLIAVRRGVEVRVLTPERSNHPLSDFAAGSCLRDLSAAGAIIQRFHKMLHGKALLVDDSLCVVGSANFDMRSLFLNYEIALFFSGRAEVERLRQWFMASFGACSLGTPRAGMLRAALDDLARLVAPLL